MLGHDLFKEACEFDRKIANNSVKRTYNFDGCLYDTVDRNGKRYITKCVLHDSRKEIDLESLEIEVEPDVIKGKMYLYLNEMDHWISYLIIKCLNGGSMVNPRKEGLKSIKKRIKENYHAHQST